MRVNYSLGGDKW